MVRSMIILALASRSTGDTAVIGATLMTIMADDSGSAYVYVRSNGVWSEQQKLTASDGARMISLA